MRWLATPIVQRLVASATRAAVLTTTVGAAHALADALAPVLAKIPRAVVPAAIALAFFVTRAPADAHPVAGGLTADQAAARARVASPDVQRKLAELEMAIADMSAAESQPRRAALRAHRPRADVVAAAHFGSDSGDLHVVRRPRERGQTALDALDADPTRIPQQSSEPARMVTFMTNNFSRIAVLTLLTSTTAFAQPTEGTAKSDVAPISNALEIAIGGGYMQGVGDIGDGMASVQDLSRAGGGGELQIAYRLSPQLALGGYTTLSSFTTGSQVAPTSDLVLGMTAGAKGDWHFRPATALDPWVSLGAGWRSMWIGNDDATEQTLHAIDVARLQVGLDYRITPSIALTPYAGASASVFFAKDTTMTSSYEEITGKTVSFAFTGGLMGRFDMFGSRGR